VISALHYCYSSSCIPLLEYATAAACAQCDELLLQSLRAKLLQHAATATAVTIATATATAAVWLTLPLLLLMYYTHHVVSAVCTDVLEQAGQRWQTACL
jgi:hypothetical protein